MLKGKKIMMLIQELEHEINELLKVIGPQMKNQSNIKNIILCPIINFAL